MPYDPETATRIVSAEAEALVLSVVLPVCDESGNIGPLIDEIGAVTGGIGPCEIICVDDGSSDGTAAEIAERRLSHPGVRLITHVKNLGQSAAMRSGILAARAPLIVTMDGDGQNDPADIPRLVAAYREASGPPPVGMVAGIRAQRRDSALRRLASRIANGIRRALLHDGAVDTGCGLRLLPRDVFLLLPYFNHMHRFLPALVRAAGYEVVFLPVGHRPRAHGRSKYGILDRLLDGVVDLFGVIWLQRRYRYGPGCALEPGEEAEKER